MKPTTRELIACGDGNCPRSANSAAKRWALLSLGQDVLGLVLADFDELLPALRVDEGVGFCALGAVRGGGDLMLEKARLGAERGFGAARIAL